MLFATLSLEVILPSIQKMHYLNFPQMLHKLTNNLKMKKKKPKDSKGALQMYNLHFLMQSTFFKHFNISFLQIL